MTTKDFLWQVLGITKNPKKRLKKINFFHIYPRKLLNNLLKWDLFLMDEEKKWMLMTYYCPTHGDSGMARQIEITKKEIRETLLKKDRNTEN